ncbi:hypothetical protein [Treponema sp.]|uniref:hypothetical protein n=1 Tax=Treponema sp. TaxID=166 RepID=UPI0025FA5049|nr:hypothetical protein [Treponema sp.]MBR4320940.1 hypothetical protein [Treponema sp.]
MKKESVIENIMVFLFVLLLLPFSKIVEEILVGSIFILCFIYCFFVSLKFIKKSNEILLYNIPYLTIITLILQIHSVRFSLLASNIQEQLFCVQLYKRLTDRLPNKEAFLIGFLIYFWLLLYILILFLENGVKRKIEVSNKFNQDTLNVQKQDIAYNEDAGIISDKQAVIENDNLVTTIELNKDIAFEIKKIRNYLVGSLVVCLCHFGSGMVKDMMFEKLCFEESFFNNAEIAVGSTIPFVCIYLMMTRFLYGRGNENE